MEMKIAICDDYPEEIVILVEYLQRMGLAGAEFKIFYNANELLNYMEDRKELFDVYLLDIEMPQMDGIELGKHIREKDKKAIIIFQSSHNEMVFDTFKIQTYRFLKKPVQFEEFEEAITSAQSLLQEKKKTFRFSFEREIYSIPYEEIIYIEKQVRKIHIYTRQKDYVCYMKMKDVLEHLNMEIFASLSASYVINMAEIKEIVKDSVITKNGYRIPISKNYKKQIKEKHFQYEMERI